MPTVRRDFSSRCFARSDSCGSRNSAVTALIRCSMQLASRFNERMHMRKPGYYGSALVYTSSGRSFVDRIGPFDSREAVIAATALWQCHRVHITLVHEDGTQTNLLSG